METLKKIAKDKIELTDDEINVYIIALLKGFGTAGSIAQYIGKGVDKVKSILSSLESKNLIKQAPGIVDRYFPLPPYPGFINYLEEFISETRTVTESIKNTFNDALKDVETEFSNTKNELENTTAGLISSFSLKITEIKNKINQEFTSLSENLKSNTDSVKNNISDSASTQVEDIRSKIDGFKNNFTSSLEGEITKLNNLITELKPKIDTAFKNVLDKLKIKNQEFKTSFNSLLDKESKTISDQITSVKDESSNLLLSSKENIGQKSDEIQSSISSNLKEFQGSGNNYLSNTQEHLSESISKYGKGSSEIISTFGESVKTSIRNFQNEQINSLQSIVETTDSKIGDLEVEVKEQVDNTITPLKETISTTIKEGIDKTNQLGSQITANLKSSLDEYKKVLTVSTNTLNEMIISAVNSLQKTQGELDQQISEVTSKITEYQTNFSEHMTQSVESFKSSMESTESTAIIKLVEQKESLNSMIENIKQGFISNARNLADEQKIKIQESSKGKFEELSKIIMDINSLISNRTKKNLDDINLTITSTQQSLSDLIEESSSQISTTVNQFKEDSSQSIENQINKISNALQYQATKLKEVFDVSKNSISGAVDTHVEDLTNFKDTANAAANEVLNQHQNSFKSAINSQKSEFDVLTTSETEKITQLINGIKDTTTKLLSENLNLSETSAKSINEAGINSVIEADTIFQTNINELKTKISGQLEEVDSSLQEKIGSTADIIKELFQKVVESAKEPKEILEKAWKDILSMELIDAEKTWHLVGNASISNFIVDMFKRTKRSILIAVPEFSNLPLQIIISELQRKALMIVTDVYGSPEKESIRKLIDLGVDLRHLTGVDFFAASRDREEVLLAPVSAQPGEQVALISELEGIIDTLGEVLGDYWRGKAKKVRQIT